MNPSEWITFTLFGFLLIIIIAIAWFVFRKRKKWAVAVTAVLVIGYVGYYAYYPTMKTNAHAAKYEQLVEYLETKYPGQQFTIRPEHYEAGVTVGTFDINGAETPDMGVTLRVDDEGEVRQISTWTGGGYPEQRDLWKDLEFHYGGDYTFDREEVEITKQDEWIDGELTVFALNIDDRPAIAVYEYAQGGYGRLDLQESQNGDFVSAEIEGYVFIYIDERYPNETAEIELQNGDSISVDAAEHKGELFIAE